MIDNLMYQLERLKNGGQVPGVSTDIKRRHNQYAVLTLHRPSNVDDPDTLRELADAIKETSRRLPIVFPVHPRTRQCLASLQIDLGSRIHLTPPLPFMEFLNLWKDARVVLTDSGGLHRCADALNDRGRSLKGSRILLLGVAYKKNVDDMRESPAAELMELLKGKGAVLDYSDPYVPIFKRMRRHSFQLRSVALTAETIAAYDLVLLTTDHDSFDYDLVQAHAKVIVDTRGRYGSAVPNVVKA